MPGVNMPVYTMPRAGDIVQFHESGLRGVGVVVSRIRNTSLYSVKIAVAENAPPGWQGHYDNSVTMHGKREFWDVMDKNLRIIKTIDGCPSYAKAIYPSLLVEAYNI